MKQLIILRDMRIDIFGDNKTYDNSKKYIIFMKF